jgi:hypothetical protein
LRIPVRGVSFIGIDADVYFLILGKSLHSQERKHYQCAEPDRAVFDDFEEFHVEGFSLNNILSTYINKMVPESPPTPEGGGNAV